MKTKTLVWGSLVALLLAGWGLPFSAALLQMGDVESYNILTWSQLILYGVGLVMGIWGAISAKNVQNTPLMILAIIFSLVILYMGITFVKYVPGIIPCTSEVAGTLKCPNY